ncbi:2-dehydro-3-deoxygalactonokinase [Bremerella sp. P1]|uniref:2-dehydro-3-deoxygalactonokinase n=1 Tax=Bremerella sp. P1 TaxID=3026424 RepID=UPI0023688B89|nr:2-dehydro-3-deoxygalactonokinase [Bremerella sp. P1]WDI43740.1 2-dehydro-3-deoxygalactonokinase [Bremerella sp. P1]
MYFCFFNCDWGTTNFRLRLVEVETRTIIAERSSNEGVAELAGVSGPHDRCRLFQSTLRRHVLDLTQTVPFDVDHVPVVISGMASSSIGWRELPYARTPFEMDGRGLVVCRLDDVEQLTQPVYLVSGLQAKNDVLRGEETELVGLGSLYGELISSFLTAWVVLPGTHSKHVLVKDGNVVDFRTYMTGELFQLLRKHSSLKRAEATGNEELNWTSPEKIDAFCEGVRLARDASLTNSLFQVRVKQLTASQRPSVSEAFLSGQLIGSEIWSLKSKVASESQIILGAGKKLNPIYQLALEIAGLADRTTEIVIDDVERLSAVGQWYAIQSHNKLLFKQG